MNLGTHLQIVGGIGMIVRNAIEKLSPKELREVIRKGKWTGETRGLCPGYAIATLVVLPKEDAYDFLLFCQRNPKPCPLIEVTDAGSPEPKISAPGADVRTDVPKYRVFRKGEIEAEVTDILSYWRDDSVALLLGCSMTVDPVLLAAGVPIRALEEQKAGSIYATNIECQPAGKFGGPLLVNMNPIPHEKVVKAVQVTSRFPGSHGAPVHIGDPTAIGITDLSKTVAGGPVTIKEGEIPVFWACGVTPSYIALKARVSMITNIAGHMFITDLGTDDSALL